MELDNRTNVNGIYVVAIYMLYMMIIRLKQSPLENASIITGILVKGPGKGKQNFTDLFISFYIFQSSTDLEVSS